MNFINKRNYITLSADNSSDLIERDKIEKKYTWNLEDIYKSVQEWENDFKFLKNQIERYYDFKGKVSESANTLLECLKFDEKISIKLDQMYLYAMLSKDLDLANAENQGRYDRLVVLHSEISAVSSFIIPEILSAKREKVFSYLKENDELKIYEHMFEDLFRTEKHRLSEREEEILSLAAPALNTSTDVFSMFNNADIDFPKVEDENGNLIQVSHGRYGAAMYSTDREYRKRVYKALYVPFKKYQNTLAATFNGNIKSLIFNAKVRNYYSTLEASLDSNNIPISVYKNLVETVNENLAPLHRWAKLKKEILNLEELHPYDTYVTLFPAVKKEYTYDEAVEIMYKALSPLGEEYLNDIKFAIENRWIDVFETKGKRSGAYSSGTTFGVHPYVLLNWNNQLNDIFTLVHEIGHNMHSFYTGNKQPYPYANYSIFVAEVASTTNEALLLDYLISNAKTDEEKLALIEMNLINIQATFFRQTRFADFEKQVHKLIESGEALTPEILTEKFANQFKKYWGPEMVVDEEEGYSWARIPHFYYNFYVYQYATSFAASQEIASKITSENNPNKTEIVEKYLNFLSAGSSDYPIDVLKKAGVDMRNQNVILSVINKMNKLLDKLESIIK